MKCPMLRQAEINSVLLYQTEASDCLGEKCAWWDSGEPGCSVKSIASLLEGLKGLVFEGVDKMPHAGQFLK